MQTLYAKMGYDKSNPLFINTLVQCIKKREELEDNPRLPHELKIFVIKKPKTFIDKL